MDNSVDEEVEETEVEEVEVTEAMEPCETSYLAITVARKGILLAIAGPKEVVLVVREMVTWITTTGQQNSPTLMIRPYVLLLVKMRLAREPCLTEPT